MLAGNQPTSMRSSTKTPPKTAWHQYLMRNDPMRAQSAGHARGARRQRGCRLAARPEALFRTPGCRGGVQSPFPLALAWL